jgi:hypothetical protein
MCKYARASILSNLMLYYISAECLAIKAPVYLISQHKYGNLQKASLGMHCVGFCTVQMATVPFLAEIFLFSTVPRLVQGPTQPPVEWGPETLSPEVKQEGHEANHSPPSNAEAKNGGAIPPLPHMPSWCGA